MVFGGLDGGGQVVVQNVSPGKQESVSLGTEPQNSGSLMRWVGVWVTLMSCEGAGRGAWPR